MKITVGRMVRLSNHQSSPFKMTARRSSAVFADRVSRTDPGRFEPDVARVGHFILLLAPTDLDVIASRV
jgi:hypothetical protein